MVRGADCSLSPRTPVSRSNLKSFRRIGSTVGVSGQAGLGRCPLTGDHSGALSDSFPGSGRIAPSPAATFVTTRGGDYFFAQASRHSGKLPEATDSTRTKVRFLLPVLAWEMQQHPPVRPRSIEALRKIILKMTPKRLSISNWPFLLTLMIARSIARSRSFVSSAAIMMSKPS